MLLVWLRLLHLRRGRGGVDLRAAGGAKARAVSDLRAAIRTKHSVLPIFDTNYRKCVSKLKNIRTIKNIYNSLEIRAVDWSDGAEFCIAEAEDGSFFKSDPNRKERHKRRVSGARGQARLARGLFFDSKAVRSRFPITLIATKMTHR